MANGAAEILRHVCSICGEACQDQRLASWAVLLLCLSPATVFLTYTYTEAAFLLCTTLGVWMQQRRQHALAALAWAASCTVRSNGATLLA